MNATKHLLSTHRKLRTVYGPRGYRIEEDGSLTVWKEHCEGGYWAFAGWAGEWEIERDPIQIEVTAESMGDGWADDYEAAQNFALFLERELSNDFYVEVRASTYGSKPGTHGIRYLPAGVDRREVVEAINAAWDTFCAVADERGEW